MNKKQLKKTEIDILIKNDKSKLKQIFNYVPYLLPNSITFASIYFGLQALLLSFEGRYESDNFKKSEIFKNACINIFICVIYQYSREYVIFLTGLQQD